MCPTVCSTMDCSTPGFLVPHHLPGLPKFMSIEAVMPSNHLIPCCPLLLLPSIFPQNQGLFQWVRCSHQVAKLLELQFQHQAFQWVSQVSIKIDWFALLAFHGILKSLLHHHSLKASFIWHSAFSIAQLSQLYDYLKYHSLDYMDLCHHYDIFAF